MWECMKRGQRVGCLGRQAGLGWVAEMRETSKGPSARGMAWQGESLGNSGNHYTKNREEARRLHKWGSVPGQSGVTLHFPAQPGCVDLISIMHIINIIQLPIMIFKTVTDFCRFLLHSGGGVW